jgi:hypothetical protein
MHLKKFRRHLESWQYRSDGFKELTDADGEAKAIGNTDSAAVAQPVQDES